MILLYNYLQWKIMENFLFWPEVALLPNSYTASAIQRGVCDGRPLSEVGIPYEVYLLRYKILIFRIRRDPEVIFEGDEKEVVNDYTHTLGINLLHGF